MRIPSLLTNAILFIVLGTSQLSALPPILDNFTTMAAGKHVGKPLSRIIDPEQVVSIAVVQNRMRDSTNLDKSLAALGLSSAELFKDAFQCQELSADYALSASEGSYGKHAVVTKEGDFYLVEFVFDTDRQRTPTAILIFGDGFGCRINQKPNKPEMATPRKSPD